MRQAEAAARIGLECFVMDAGWYGGCPSGDFEPGVGNWEIIDKAKFPNGIEPVAEIVRSKGMQFGLWFEPERAHRDSHWAREHPEWFRPHRAGAAGRPAFLHIDFGCPEARQAVIRVIGEAIERLDLRWIKWDYNTGPLLYEGLGDPDGKALARHIEGLYEVLDTLLERYPGVLFEACASGGRRIDLGILRRAHTVWISDHSHIPSVCRFMQLGAARCLPGHLLNLAVPVERGAGGSHGLTAYQAACRMAGSLAFHGDIASWPDETIKTARRFVEAYKGFRQLMLEDFHPLIPQPVREEEWEAAEFCAADGREAVVMAYSGQAGPREKLLRLHALLPEARYRVRQPLEGDAAPTSTTGQALMDQGLHVALDSCASAVFLLQVE